MSSSAPSEGPGGSDRPTGGDRRQSFNKFMTRAKSALKRDKTKRQSSSGDLSSNKSVPLPMENYLEASSMKLLFVVYHSDGERSPRLIVMEVITDTQ